MLIQKQLELKDCWRTCIASILGLPAKEVPHFYEIAGWDTDLAEMMAKQWLHSKGYNLVTVQFAGGASFEDMLQLFSKVTDGLYYIMSGRSKSKSENHAVVCKDAQVVLDPLFGKAVQEPFRGPCVTPDGDKRWIVEIIVRSVV